MANKSLKTLDIITVLMKNDRVREFKWLDTRSWESIPNHSHIISEQKARILENKITEKKIRLGWDVPNLELKPYKNGNQEEIKFIYNLKKEVYQKYVEKIYGEWNEENQKKLFNKFMKENSKNIELIYLKDKLVGFYNGKTKDDNSFEIDNICIMPEYQNKGIGTAVLKEILFENKDKEVSLQCFKDNPAIDWYKKIGFEKISECPTLKGFNRAEIYRMKKIPATYKDNKKSPLFNWIVGTTNTRLNI